MLNDLLAPNLKLVICGTAAGAQSAARGEYYAGQGNKFWRVLFEVGLTPRRLGSHEYQELLSCGIGLTDVAKNQAGNDAQIDFKLSDPSRVRADTLHFCPSVLAFNGKKAAQIFLGKRRVEYGFQAEVVGDTRLFVVPSTSGAANGYWDIGIWHELAAQWPLVKRF